MPAVSTLNVRIGVDPQQFIRGLNEIERQARRWSYRLGRVANEASLSLSAPLIGLGVFSIQAAGDIESLRLALETTMKSAGYSINQARQELEALRVAALAPGLDFEQAVRGSIRLQNVGYSAESARDILIQLANAVALTGGTARELDGVTRQFAQMIAKGRILQEDLTIIQENMPAVGQALKNAFGTSSAERLRELGLTVEQVIEGVTKELTKLPRVQGGIKNAIVNLFAGLKLEAAAFGEAINRAFNIERTGERLIQFIRGLRTWFESLSPFVQKLIIQFGLLLAVVGPGAKVIAGFLSVFSLVPGIIKGVGALATWFAGFPALVVRAYGALSVFFASMLSGLKASIAAAGGLRAILATIGGPVIIGLTLLVSVIVGMANALSDANAATDAFNKAKAETLKLASKERVTIEQSFSVLRRSSATYNERKAAIERLKTTYPDYLKNIDLEKASLEELNKIQNELTSSVIRNIAERQKALALEKIYEEQAKILLDIQKLRQGDSKGFLGDFATGLVGGRQALINDLERKLQDLQRTARDTALEYDRAFGIGYESIKTFDQAISGIAERDDLLVLNAERLNERFRQTAQAAESLSDVLADVGIDNNLPAVAKQSEDAERAARKMAQALSAVKADLKAFDAKIDLGIKKDDLEVAVEKAKLLESSIQRLLKAGFDVDSEPVKRLNAELENINNNIKVQLDEAKKIREFWSSPVRVPEPVIPKLEPQPISFFFEKQSVEGLRRSFQELQREVFVPKRGVKAAAPVLLFDMPENLDEKFAGVVAGANKAIASLIPLGQQLKEAMTPAEATIDGLRKGLVTFEESWRVAMDNSATHIETFGERFASAVLSMDTTIGSLSEEVLGVSNILKYFGETVGESFLAAADAVYTFGIKNREAFSSIREGFKAVAGEALRAALRVVRARLMEAIATQIAKALSSFPFPLNLAIAAGAASAVSALFSVAMGKIGIPELAEGGVVRKKTLVVVGEYPGASTNPEIIAPENKIREIIREEGGGNGALMARISGDDLLFILDRANSKRNRTR